MNLHDDRLHHALPTTGCHPDPAMVSYTGRSAAETYRGVADKMSTDTCAQRRFAITATDRYQPVMEAFIAKGWTPIKLFTVPTDERLHSNKAVIARAQELGMQIQLSRLDEAALLALKQDGCELLIVASYPWRIGNWRPCLPLAINFHPSPLPMYRGPYPQVWAILDQQKHWGVSCHILEHAFDSGAILAQEAFDLSRDECHDSLDLKIQMAMRTLAETVAADLDNCLHNARPQGDGHYAGFWSDADRTLDFSQPCEHLDRQLRAFGPHECLATINGVPLRIRRALTWQSVPSTLPGRVVHVDGARMVITCRDGYVGLLEWGFQAAGNATRLDALV